MSTRRPGERKFSGRILEQQRVAVLNLVAPFAGYTVRIIVPSFVVLIGGCSRQLIQRVRRSHFVAIDIAEGVVEAEGEIARFHLKRRAEAMRGVVFRRRVPIGEFLRLVDERKGLDDSLVRQKRHEVEAQLERERVDPRPLCRHAIAGNQQDIVIVTFFGGKGQVAQPNRFAPLGAGHFWGLVGPPREGQGRNRGKRREQE